MKTINSNLSLLEFFTNTHCVIFMIAIIAVIVFLPSVVVLFKNFDGANNKVVVMFFYSAVIAGCTITHLSVQYSGYKHNQDVIKYYVSHEVGDNTVAVCFNGDKGIIANTEYPIRYKADIDTDYFDVATGTYYTVSDE